MDAIGQKGVQRVDKLEMVETAIARAQKFSASGRVIIEEFVSGEELGINGFITFDGVFHCVCIGHRNAEKANVPSFGVAFQKLAPVRKRYDQLVVDVTHDMQKLVNHLGLRNCPLYAQAIATRS